MVKSTGDNFPDGGGTLPCGVNLLWGYTRKKILKPQLAWYRGPQDQLAILHGEADLSTSPQANLLSKAAGNPHTKSVSPLLNLRPHAQLATSR